MESQKLLAKKYSFLNGKQIEVFIGRVPCKFKHIEKELSLTKKSNEFGEYQQILVTINKTNYNGKKLTIDIKNCYNGAVLRPFEIPNDEIIKLLN